MNYKYILKKYFYALAHTNKIKLIYESYLNITIFRQKNLADPALISGFSWGRSSKVIQHKCYKRYTYAWYMKVTYDRIVLYWVALVQDLVFACARRHARARYKLKPGLALGLLTKRLFYGRAIVVCIILIVFFAYFLKSLYLLTKTWNF